VVHLPDDCDDVQLMHLARLQQIDIRPLSAYFIAPPIKRGVVAGYGYLPLEEIAAAATKLAKLINEHLESLS